MRGGGVPAPRTQQQNHLGLLEKGCVWPAGGVRPPPFIESYNGRGGEVVVGSMTDWSRVVIAYEPVWAIGTGQVSPVRFCVCVWGGGPSLEGGRFWGGVLIRKYVDTKIRHIAVRWSLRVSQSGPSALDRSVFERGSLELDLETAITLWATVNARMCVCQMEGLAHSHAVFCTPSHTPAHTQHRLLPPSRLRRCTHISGLSWQTAVPPPPPLELNRSKLN